MTPDMKVKTISRSDGNRRTTMWGDKKYTLSFERYVRSSNEYMVADSVIFNARIDTSTRKFWTNKKKTNNNSNVKHNFQREKRDTEIECVWRSGRMEKKKKKSRTMDAPRRWQFKSGDVEYFIATQHLLFRTFEAGSRRWTTRAAIRTKSEWKNRQNHVTFLFHLYLHTKCHQIKLVVPGVCVYFFSISVFSVLISLSERKKTGQFNVEKNNSMA